MQQTNRLQHIISRLRNAGFRLTPQRAAVIHYLLPRKDHPSAETIFQSLMQQFPMITRATIYNTLAMLIRLNEAQDLGSWYDLRRFDGNPAPHPHIVCLKCRRVDDLPVAIPDATSQQVAASSGFQVIQDKVEFYGYCPDCQLGTGNASSANR